MDFNIICVINHLRFEEKRIIFTSESDFKYAIAKAIENTYPGKAKVRLEYCRENDPDKHIDILVLWGKDKQWIPIELKYKTKEFNGYVDKDGCQYNLKNQSAHNNGCYDYLKDISRIQTIKTDKSIPYKTGFAIFLTNDTCYKNIKKRNDENNYYDSFRIFNGRKIESNTTLEWGTGANPSKERRDSITLNKKYIFKWKKYSTVKNSNNIGKKSVFSYLITQI